MRLLPVLLTAVALSLVQPCSHSLALATTTAPSHRLFVTNYRDDTVSVINGDTHHEERVLKVGATPQGIAHRSNPPLVAVSASTASEITLIDPISLDVVGTIETGAEPEDLVFSRDGKHLYATSAATKSVHVLDVEKREEVAALPPAKMGRPVRLQLSPDGTILYVLIRSKQGAVWVVNLESTKVEKTIPVGVNSNDFALSSDGRWLVSSSFADDRLSVIDTTSREVVATHPAPTGAGLVMHPTKSRVFSLASFDDAVHAIDYQTGAKMGTAEVGESPQYGSIDPDGRVLYVAYEDSNRIIAIDTDTMQQLWRAGVGDEPADIEYVSLSGLGEPPLRARNNQAPDTQALIHSPQASPNPGARP